MQLSRCDKVMPVGRYSTNSCFTLQFFGSALLNVNNFACVSWSCTSYKWQISCQKSYNRKNVFEQLVFITQCTFCVRQFCSSFIHPLQKHIYRLCYACVVWHKRNRKWNRRICSFLNHQHTYAGLNYQATKYTIIPTTHYHNECKRIITKKQSEPSIRDDHVLQTTCNIHVRTHSQEAISKQKGIVFILH